MYPFIITTIAGLSTMLGILPIFVKKINNNNLISISCSFASGVMICVSILDLIPESIRYLSNYYINYKVIFFSFIFILIGILFSLILDKLIDKYSNSNNLFKVGLLSMIAIILHNIPEGIVTYIVSNKDIILGLSICIAIALHNIPEGISIAVPIYYSTKSIFTSITYTFISSISEPFGAIITYLFLSKYINDLVLGLLFSFIAGIMLQISYNKLFPVSYSYNKKISYYFFIIGFIFMTISLLLNNLIS